MQILYNLPAVHGEHAGQICQPWDGRCKRGCQISRTYQDGLKLSTVSGDQIPRSVVDEHALLRLRVAGEFKGYVEGFRHRFAIWRKHGDVNDAVEDVRKFENLQHPQRMQAVAIGEDEFPAG